MSASAVRPPFDRFLATADAVARERAEVDLEPPRDIFLVVATRLDVARALDGRDSHDAGAVAEGLCADLVTTDPGAAVRARSTATAEDPGDLHDPEAVSRAYLFAATILQL